jgi:hypothetical protein
MAMTCQDGYITFYIPNPWDYCIIVKYLIVWYYGIILKYLILWYYEIMECCIPNLLDCGIIVK